MVRFIILHIEDDPDDVFFLQSAFEANGLGDCLRVARDGEEAVAYLLGQGAFADRAKYPRPSLILLDLNLPRKSGLEVLAWRRQQPELKLIPTVVLTSSNTAADIRHAYELGANSFLVKPVDPAMQDAIVKAIRRYWIDLNQLPGPSEEGSRSDRSSPL